MTKPGAGKTPSMQAPGPSVQDLLDQERTAVPDVLRDTSALFLGNEPIPKERYTSPDFFDAEMDQMWSRVWQVACREEDIPQPGDYEVYEIGDTSLLIVRVTDNEIRAYYNVCLHRGRLLREEGGHADEFKCPFHGFTWALDGTCKKITSDWDFQYLDKKDLPLPQAHVDTWGGFIFINLADDPEPLADYLEDIPAIYETRGWSLEDRVKAIYVSKINTCNWKIALEAFTESFHVIETHRSATPYIADANTQYDVWPGTRHYSRMIVPRGLHSPLIDPLTDTEVFRAGVAAYAPDLGESGEIPEGLTPRQAMGDVRRDYLNRNMDIDAADLTDSEVLDTIQYHVFPNLVIWAGWNSFLAYRFRPNGSDVNSSIMDVMILVPKNAEGGPESVREPTRLTAEQPYVDAPQLGGLGDVFDEDVSNMGAVHKGLKAMKGPGARFASYQEMRLRFFHQTLMSYLEQNDG